MRDRLPTPGKENRVRITQDNGQVVEGTLAYADGATQEGSPYTKGNVLPDDVCGILGIDPVTSEPKDAWLGVIKAVGYSILTIEVQDIDGTPAAGVQVSGLTGVLDEKTYTGPDGKIFLILKEGSYTLSVPKFEGCIDASMNSVSASIGAGEVKTVLLKPVSNGVKSLTITSSRTVKFSSNVVSIDVFCCGGGGGGGAGNGGSAFPGAGGGGGGGGYTETRRGLTVSAYVDYRADIGAGGYGASYNSNADDGASGGYGGSTSFLGVSASGGQGGRGATDASTNTTGGVGGRGGSGGGGGGAYSGAAGSGGTDGSDGTSGSGDGGKGQGTTTRAFGEPGGTLYAGGGKGGSNSGSGSPGRGTYGLGGNGGRTYSSGTGGNGVSGAIEARWVTKA